MPWIRRALLIAVFALAACEPKYNWRQMPVADGAVQVTFPAKPKSGTRNVVVAGTTLPLTFTLAEIDTSIFAVGYATIPDDVLGDPARLSKLADGFEDVLRNNLQGTLRERKEVPLRQSPADTRKLQRSVQLEVHGMVANEPSWLLGRVYVLGNRMIEVVAFGRESQLPVDAAQTFVQSVTAQ